MPRSNIWKRSVLPSKHREGEPGINPGCRNRDPTHEGDPGFGIGLWSCPIFPSGFVPFPWGASGIGGRIPRIPGQAGMPLECWDFGNHGGKSIPNTGIALENVPWALECPWTHGMGRSQRFGILPFRDSLKIMEKNPKEEAQRRIHDGKSQSFPKKK